MEDENVVFGMLEKLKRNMPRKKYRHLKIGCFFIVLFAVIACVFWGKNFFSKEEKPEIITESQLYKIIKVSELYTYQCVYNGVCTVKDKEDSTKELYYCAYEAKVNAGFDFLKLKIEIEDSVENKKIIKVTIPKVTLAEPDVTLESLDYMFIDDDANTETVSEEAYKECILDVKQKAGKEIEILRLAQQNAKNIITALIRPFVEQANSSDIEYELEIQNESLEGESVK